MKDDKLNVLHISSNYLYTTLYEKMVEKLELNNIRNTVYTPVDGKTKFVIQPKEYVYYPICFRRIDRLWYGIKQFKILKNLKQLIDLKTFDIIHAHTLFTDGGIANRLWHEFKMPYIVAVRNTDVNIFFKRMPYLRKRGVKILVEAKAVIFLSETYKEEVIKKYIPSHMREEVSKKTFVIPNGIDDFWLNNKGSIKRKVKKENINLIYVGVINKNKNIITTTKAIDILLKKGYKVNFTVVGRVEDKAIFNKISALDFVSYIGTKSKEELLNIYRKNDVFVMPSFTETFGLVYAEAITQGVPVIYTKGQGFDGQFIDGKVGYSVDPTDENEIAYKIELLLQDISRISENCIKNADKFCWYNISGLYASLYCNICSGKESN